MFFRHKQKAQSLILQGFALMENKNGADSPLYIISSIQLSRAFENRIEKKSSIASNVKVLQRRDGSLIFGKREPDSWKREPDSGNGSLILYGKRYIKLSLSFGNEIPICEILLE